MYTCTSSSSAHNDVSHPPVCDVSIPLLLSSTIFFYLGVDGELILSTKGLDALVV